MTIRCGEAKAAEMPVCDLAKSVYVVRIWRVFDEAVVAQLRGQYVTSRDALGVFKVFGISLSAQYQGCFDNIARVVDLSAIGTRIVSTVLDYPSNFIANFP